MRKRSEFLFAAVCAMTLLLMTGHAMAQDTAEVGLALAARARRAPATPLEMALRLEKELAMGAGILMPIPERQVRLSGGVIPLDGKTGGFPAEFFMGLVPDKLNGVEAWRATLRTDDASGDMLFYNADGQVFWSVAADAAVWSADWIARLHSLDGEATDFFSTGQVLLTLSEKQTRVKVPEDALYRSAWLATRQYFLPSHVEMMYTFILKEDLDAYRSGGTGARSLVANAMSMSAPLTGLAVTGFATDTNGVALSAAWPTGTAIAGDALDIFFTRTLIPPAWSNLWRVAVEPAVNAIDIAIPRSELPPAPEAVPAACVTNIVPSAYDPGVMITNIVCTNTVWLTDSGFFRLADLADTDGDGLTDACEKWMYGTRADLIDTDGDTLGDGWEIKYGLNPFVQDDPSADPDDDGLIHAEECAAGTDPFNGDTDGDGLKDKWEVGHSLDPLSPDGLDGASGDPDTDGLPNIAEFRAGTDPHVGDWDGDGSLDGKEAGWWGYAAPLPWYNVSGGTSVLYNVNLDSGLIPANLPFPVRIGGAVCTNALLDVNGVAYFIDRLKRVDSWVYSRDSNFVLTNSQPLTDNHFAVAAHWDDLRARTLSPATKITIASVTTNGVRYCVIEYRDMGFYSNSAARVSFQIVIPESETNTVYVRYPDTGAADGGLATLGAQGPGAAINIPVAFNRSFITNGLTLAYHFGSGGSPFVKDTDGDGLEDGEEVALGTSPANTDSDGDGLPDKWEAENALDPLSSAGDDGADGDPDGDGLLNRDESAHDADPHNTDTDGDGLADLEEAGGITPADIPWFNLSAGDDITPLFSSLDDSCLTMPLAAPATICGAVFTNLTLDINGLAYFNPTGYQNTAYSKYTTSNMAEGTTVNPATLTLAPFWSNLIAVTNTAPASKILSGIVSDGTNRYRVVEYRNMRRWQERSSTNSLVSFQLATLTGATDRVFVRYALASGTADGRYASVGLQGLGGAQKDSWCFEQAGRVWPGLSLALVIGTGSDPQKKDTDDDLLPDGWEHANGLSPLSSASPDGAGDDPDGDLFTNLDEYRLGTDPHVPDGPDDDHDGLHALFEYAVGTDPHNPDCDSDGTTDGDEVLVYGSDPRDPLDGAADTDGDGLTDIEEDALGTDPGTHDSMADTDGDGILDIPDPAPSDPSAPVQGAAAFTVIHPAQGALLP